VVFKFQGGQGSTLEAVAEGAGGWDEAAKLLDQKDGAYVLLRKDHKVEISKTVKFAFVDWFPNGMKLLRRTAISSLKKPIQDLMKPYHVELSASELRDVDQKTIDDKIGFVSGTASHVKGKGETPAVAAVAESPKAESAAPAPTTAPSEAKAEAESAKPAAAEKKAPAKPVSTAKPSVASSSGGLRFTDQAAWDAAIKDIRNDKKDTNWIVTSYSDRDTLTVLGAGADGFDGMMAKIDENAICFGLLRVIELIDLKSKTTKFIFVKYVPDSIKPMKKAEIPTRAGAIEKLFGQSHVQIDISKKSDLTEEAAMKKLGQASGSASNVVAKK